MWMPTNFAKVNTTCARKLEVVNLQIQSINHHFPKNTLKGLCVGVPGAGSQALRHRDEYLAYGIPEERQVMVDYDRNVSAGQRRYMSREGYRGKIVCSELQKTLKKFWNAGKHVDIIDYDDVTYLQPRHEDIIRDAQVNNVNAIIIVITTRCPALSDYHKQWKERLGLQKRYVKTSKKWHEPLRDIQLGAIKEIGEQCGYFLTMNESYSGYGPPMLSCVLVKK